MSSLLAANIYYLRKKDKLSQEEFAERFGVSRQSVAKWESGDSTPDVYKCLEIAEHYGITLDVLLVMSLEDSEYKAKSADGKYIFGLVKVGSRGQVVIPKYAREVFGINAGDVMAVFGDSSKGGIAFAKISYNSLLDQKK